MIRIPPIADIAIIQYDEGMDYLPTETSSLDQPVYMVNAEDENGDHHIFISMDQGRAEAQYEAALQAFRSVKANWLERREDQGQ